MPPKPTNDVLELIKASSLTVRQKKQLQQCALSGSSFPSRNTIVTRKAVDLPQDRKTNQTHQIDMKTSRKTLDQILATGAYDIEKPCIAPGMDREKERIRLAKKLSGMEDLKTEKKAIELTENEVERIRIAEIEEEIRERTEFIEKARKLDPQVNTYEQDIVLQIEALKRELNKTKQNTKTTAKKQ